MFLYTRTISTTIETHVETRMVSESEKKRRNHIGKKQIRERTKKVSVSYVLMTLASITKRKNHRLFRQKLVLLLPH
jgi:hypothetical protein